MADPIISRDLILQKARDAFARGTPREENPFPWHSPAYSEWEAEYDRLTNNNDTGSNE